MSKGLLIILTGPTASGKDAIMHGLMKHDPKIHRLITTTSRAPREGEINGQDYYFVSRVDFEQMLKSGDFLESIEYSGNYYGTTKTELTKVLGDQDMIWRIDPTMAAKVTDEFAKAFDLKTFSQLISRTLVIFIDVPDIETIYNRLKIRGIDKQDLKQRLEKDQQNIRTLKDKFKHIVINYDGKLDQTINQVLNLIREKKAQLAN